MNVVPQGEAVIAHVQSEYSLLLGERSAEDIKVAAGSAFPLSEEWVMVHDGDRFAVGKR